MNIKTYYHGLNTKGKNIIKKALHIDPYTIINGCILLQFTMDNNLTLNEFMQGFISDRFGNKI